MLGKQSGLFVILMCAGSIAAAATTGNTLPWEGPLQTFVTSITGPVAFAGSAIALTAAFLTLAFNSEITGFARYMVYLGLAISGLLFVVNLLTSMFGAGAATTGSIVILQMSVTLLFIALTATLAAIELAVWRWAKKRMLSRQSANSVPLPMAA
ncbi:MAG: TrbC/VirB2 family protein [Granulosicoccus sp.]